MKKKLIPDEVIEQAPYFKEGRVGVKDRLEVYESGKYGLDEFGYEHPDPTPVEIPTRLRMPGNQVARIRRLIAQEMSDRAAADGMESFEESDDFELEDEEWVSPYEEVFEPVVRSGSGDKPGNDGGSNVSTSRKDGVDGDGAPAGGVGVGRGQEGTGAPGGTSGGAAGSSGGVGGADSRDRSVAGKGESRGVK